MNGQPRVLFHSSSRRGLGHAMRSANLARAVLAASPTSAVLVHLTHSAASVACGDVPCIASDPSRTGEWRRVLDAFTPTLVVFDTIAPGAWADDDTPRVFVWRHSVPDRHARLVDDEQVRRACVYIIPHTREEFGYELPPELADRAVFTGPLVRGTDRAGQDRVRDKYDLGDTTPLITSTVGGGGFGESAGWLLDVALTAHDRLAARIPGLRHIVVCGPLAAPHLRASCHAERKSGLTCVDGEADLVHLFALSRMVVAEAGYNTVQEIQHVAVPALLAPGERTFDHQAGRAQWLADRGLARALSRGSKADAIETLVALAADGRALAEMRARLRACRPLAGNQRAAAALLAAAR